MMTTSAAGTGFSIGTSDDDDGPPRSSMDIDPPTKNGLDTAASHSMDVDESSPTRNASNDGHDDDKANGTTAPAAAAPANNATASAGPSNVTTTLDCYPYTFTPLLLFAPENYFDKGYSNYNAVAQFFSSVMPVDMLDNVLFERRNLLYEELFDHIVTHHSFVTCCIDAHFTALQILPKNAAIYYDPCSPRIKLVTGESFRTLVLFLLIKCNYGDSEHVRDNKDYYVNSGSTVRRTIYSIWKNINRINSVATLSPMKMTSLNIDTDRFFFINSPGYPTAMTTQRTGNTCYFQVYLFAVLCKVGNVILLPSKESLRIPEEDRLETTVIAMLEFLMTFFYDGKIMRPLTNCNVLVDFFRFRSSPYFKEMTLYLEKMHRRNPNYEAQFYELLAYFERTAPLHTYERFGADGVMASTLNSKMLQAVRDSSGALQKLGSANYYKYRAANFMFGCNANILREMESFAQWQAWRKNQLLAVYGQVDFTGTVEAVQAFTKYRDYYFMAQYEIGQPELVHLHHYLYLLDVAEFCSLDAALIARLHAVNHVLVNHMYFSTQKTHNYDTMMELEDFKRSRGFKLFLNSFLTPTFFKVFTALGFAEINPAEEDINNLTQTVFYTNDLLSSLGGRQSVEFSKECINQLSRALLRRTLQKFDEPQIASQKYKIIIKIGQGLTISKYNTLLHFLSVVKSYWHNPDLSNVHVFGKDIRTLLTVSCQKIFFDPNHCGYYFYGPFDNNREMDLVVATNIGHAVPTVSIDKRKKENLLIITDRVFEYQYLRKMLLQVFSSADGAPIKTDNEVVNLCLLSLMLDFGLYEEYCDLLRLPFILERLQHKNDSRELQVEIANLIYECDRKNTSDNVTRGRVEQLMFECASSFIVNKDFSVHSQQFKLIKALNADPDYQSYVIMVKIYKSLCQINKSSELDYYKIFCDGTSSFRLVIPKNFSQATSDYLDVCTKQYTFSERNGFLFYDDRPVFDLRPHQPEINLHRVRFDSASAVQSMVQYIEISNAFREIASHADKTAVEVYLVFVAGNVLEIETGPDGSTRARINKADMCVCTVYLESFLSFIPAFYTDTGDVIVLKSPNFYYKVDAGGQFAPDYYGMKSELSEYIMSDELFVDANDAHAIKACTLQDLAKSETKSVFYAPYFLVQPPTRQHLIALLDLAIKLRNVPFFILILTMLRRCSMKLEFLLKDKNGTSKITGPWRQAVAYVINDGSRDAHYDAIFKKQFFDLNTHKTAALSDFIDVLCENFTHYQRHINGRAEIVPRPEQKEFLKRIITAAEPFHFSAVGSGKTKVILPLFCQAFLSNNRDVHRHLAKGGSDKCVLVVLVPSHLVSDATTQVFRYCLSLNYGDNYRIFDDIMALTHKDVQIRESSKMIFVTSFNLFKKALTIDSICAEIRPFRDRFLLLVDEVDDFLDRDKILFNSCSNKNNSLERSTLDLYFEVSRSAYHRSGCPSACAASHNPDYWTALYNKFVAIHAEIQMGSRSINKSFGITNASSLRHCSTSIAHDIEGYKSLIARPYESVNRAMPGSYFSDVERTIFLTFVIMAEDVAKYNELFQAERKFITYEYWQEHLHHSFDFDDLIYGHEALQALTEIGRPETIYGLQKYLYDIILRRMEVQAESRSVNSIDVIFNMAAVGFTGTPFLDNYPTFEYIRKQRRDDIPSLIDRSFYAYTCEGLVSDVFEDRFKQFQGANDQVQARYICSEFIQSCTAEMDVLRSLFHRETGYHDGHVFNVCVDLVGLFKTTTVHDIRTMLLDQFGLNRFHYVYHIDQTDNSDRVLCLETANDSCFDEEWYKFGLKRYRKELPRRVFFFIDNRNVIGKDVPFQLAFLRDFGSPLFSKSLVLAHDVDDFSKIWQAMGRSRTLNYTEFCIYRSGISGMEGADSPTGDIKTNPLTRQMYVTNCDRRVAGNISSIYLTLIAAVNLANDSFYYCDPIVNTFLEKMENRLKQKIAGLADQLIDEVQGKPVAAQILLHILADKFKKSANPSISAQRVTDSMVETVLRHVVDQKFEIRRPTSDIFDDIVAYLSGEQESQTEISYTKQQQKQKQTQQNKNQDTDSMSLFNKANQLTLGYVVSEYYERTKRPNNDKAKVLLSLPAHDPIVSFSYVAQSGECRSVCVYPTLQFLYSHFIDGAFMSQEVKQTFQLFDDNVGRYTSAFFASARATREQKKVENTRTGEGLKLLVHWNYVRQNPQYSIAALENGIYVIGTKDQFNAWDIVTSPLRDQIVYVMDEVGFVLFDCSNSKSVDELTPYGVDNYLLMELLAKQEVAQNVIDSYCRSKAELQQAVDSYDGKQGKGFVCWRFLMNARLRKELPQATAAVTDDANMDLDTVPSFSGNKRTYA